MDTGFESESEGPESAKQYGSMRSLEVVLDEGLQQVECFVYNSIDMEVGHVMAIIEGVGKKKVIHGIFKFSEDIY